MTDTPRPILNIDVAEFEHYLAECEGTEKEKREYLELISQIVCELVMIGFEIHPLQQAQEACGKPLKSPVESTILSHDMLNSLDPEIAQHIAAAQEGENNQ